MLVANNYIFCKTSLVVMPYYAHTCIYLKKHLNFNIYYSHLICTVLEM